MTTHEQMAGALRTCQLAAMAVSESTNPDLRAALPAIQASLQRYEAAHTEGGGEGEWLRGLAKACQIHTVRAALGVNFSFDIAPRLHTIADRLELLEAEKAAVAESERQLIEAKKQQDDQVARNLEYAKRPAGNYVLHPSYNDYAEGVAAGLDKACEIVRRAASTPAEPAQP